MPQLAGYFKIIVRSFLFISFYQVQQANIPVYFPDTRDTNHSKQGIAGY